MKSIRLFPFIMLMAAGSLQAGQSQRSPHLHVSQNFEIPLQRQGIQRTPEVVLWQHEQIAQQPGGNGLLSAQREQISLQPLTISQQSAKFWQLTDSHQLANRKQITNTRGSSNSIQLLQANGRLEIKINNNIFKPGDSLYITAQYTEDGAASPQNASPQNASPQNASGRTGTGGSASGQNASGQNPSQPNSSQENSSQQNSRAQARNQSLATLALIIENEEGQRARLRWPMINGQASGAIFLPDSLPLGKYTILAGLQERFFEVTGQVKDEKNIGSIQAMLLTKTGEWDEQKVSVAPDGTFAIRNWLFEDNALVAFHGSKNNDELLNISISSQLDSSFDALAVAGRTFYIGNPPAAVRTTLNQPVEAPETLFGDRGTVLPAVIVRSKMKTPAQQYNEEHVSGLFRSGDERIISVMEDPSALGFTNIFSYLQSRVAGLQIRPTGLSGGVASWRGSPVTFFVDEMRVPAQQVANIPMTDVAIVKAYPPPFIGAPGGGGGVAIYTRRGGEANYLPANRQVFRVRGYTPSSIALDMSKLSF